MADPRAWRPASDPPPEGVPVFGINDVGICAIMVYEWMDDGECGGYVWANSYGQIWQKGTGWDCDAEYDDDYTARYWHPLPAVPTLAELDGLRGVDTTDADLDAFCERYGNALRGLAAHPMEPAAEAASGGGE